MHAALEEKGRTLPVACRLALPIPFHSPLGIAGARLFFPCSFAGQAWRRLGALHRAPGPARPLFPSAQMGVPGQRWMLLLARARRTLPAHSVQAAWVGSAAHSAAALDAPPPSHGSFLVLPKRMPPRRPLRIAPNSFLFPAVVRNASLCYACLLVPVWAAPASARPLVHSAAGGGGPRAHNASHFAGGLSRNTHQRRNREFLSTYSRPRTLCVVMLGWRLMRQGSTQWACVAAATAAMHCPRPGRRAAGCSPASPAVAAVCSRVQGRRPF